MERLVKNTHRDQAAVATPLWHIVGVVAKRSSRLREFQIHFLLPTLFHNVTVATPDPPSHADDDCQTDQETTGDDKLPIDGVDRRPRIADGDSRSHQQRTELQAGIV